MESGLRGLAATVAPPRCAVCTRPTGAVQALCARCEAALGRQPGGIARLAAAGDVCWAAVYEGTARRLVAGLKFAGRTRLAEVAAEAISAALARWAPWATERAPADAPVIIPVPPAAPRMRRRGFDPAALIAAALGRTLELPVALPLVRSDSRRQVGRPRAARLADPPRIVAAGPSPARVLIVDDVTTTGATLGACAAALRGAGAESAAAAVFARSL